MRPSSTARSAAGYPTPTSCSPTSIREYRRPRTHLFPLEAYRAAVATGGSVRSYCGILEIPRGDPADVEEAVESRADDCATCIDLWHGRRWVRL